MQPGVVGGKITGGSGKVRFYVQRCPGGMCSHSSAHGPVDSASPRSPRERCFRSRCGRTPRWARGAWRGRPSSSSRAPLKETRFPDVCSWETRIDACRGKTRASRRRAGESPPRAGSSRKPTSRTDSKRCAPRPSSRPSLPSWYVPQTPRHLGPLAKNPSRLPKRTTPRPPRVPSFCFFILTREDFFDARSAKVSE